MKVLDYVTITCLKCGHQGALPIPIPVDALTCTSCFSVTAAPDDFRKTDATLTEMLHLAERKARLERKLAAS